MELQANVAIDPEMDAKIKSNQINITDRVKLTLANWLAALFPLIEVYINPQKQGVKEPAVFVDFYEINKTRKLAYTSQYEYGFTLSYIPKDPLSNTELHDAEFLILQNITDLTDYSIHSVNGDITDSIVNVTGVISVGEKNVSMDPIIMKAKEDITHGK